jgi:signal transduction histidine kinase
MLTIGKEGNRIVFFIFSLLIISVIGFLDSITGPELSFSFFYLIPIAFLAIYHGTKIIYLIIISVFASLLWFLAEYGGREYSHVLFPIWNAFVRLAIFISIGFLIFFLKEKHKKLELINNNLQTLNDEKNRIIGIAAHDLRNPISGIYSFSDLLISDYKDRFDTEILDILNMIRSTSDSTLGILRNLLDVSKIESGKIELKIKRQDYLSFIKGHIAMNQMLANKKGILIKLSSQTEDIFAEFDEYYLSEVIVNLLTNAIKFSNSDTTIEVKISLTGNNQILTRVIDEGKGIPEDEQQKLFNYFQKTSVLPTDGESSTGLGLAIAKQIVIRHNGEIGVKSIPNVGSDFYYLIPIQNSLDDLA